MAEVTTNQQGHLVQQSQLQPHQHVHIQEIHPDESQEPEEEGGKVIACDEDHPQEETENGIVES